MLKTNEQRKVDEHLLPDKTRNQEKQEMRCMKEVKQYQKGNDRKADKRMQGAKPVKRKRCKKYGR
jgi:hypothetical protein